MKAIKYFVAILFSVAVAACGGGGGGSPATSITTISGTAAAGAPVVGYVSVRDSSNNTQPVRTNIPIEANGHYTVDVTGLTPPYAFLASGTVGGKTVSLYSAATADDAGKTINITPFTDLIIRNIAAGAVDTYLANHTANLTTAQLDAQRVALTNQLAPALTAMGVSSSIDLLRATFNADSTGLDRFMDVVKVDTTNPSAVTISNIMDAASQLVVDTTTGTVTGTLPTANMSPTATPFDGMKASADAFSALFATSLPSPTNASLTALFTSTFMDNGRSQSAFLTDLTTQQALIGFKFANFGIDNLDSTNTIAKVHFTPISATGELLDHSLPSGVMYMKMIKNVSTGVWQLDGNGRIARVRVRTVAVKGICNPASSMCAQVTPNLAITPDYQTGLALEIDNQAQLPIGSAIVTGPGLPPGGVTLAAIPNQNWLQITTPNVDIVNGSSVPRCADYVLCNTYNWLMTDSEIALVAVNSVYTIQLWSNAATPVLMATYTETLPVPPVLNAAKAAIAYPSMTGMINLTGTGASTLTPSWSIPTGLSGESLGVYVWQQDPATYAMTASTGNWMSLNASSGTATLPITAPSPGGTWTGGNYRVDADDQYGGSVTTFYP